MAYLTKEQYDKRRDNASNRNAENEEILVDAGWAESDAELISRVCALRHEFHCHMEDIAKYGSQGSEALRELNELDGILYDRGLPTIEGLPCEEDMDDMDGLTYYYGDDVPEDHDSEEFWEWYNENFDRILDELNDGNNAIERYLKSIDDKYGTHFAPTGAQRIF